MKHFNVCTKVKLPYKLVTERIAFIGMSGTGKSYAATKTAEEMLEAGAQIVYVDPVGIGYGLRIGANGEQSKGFAVYVFGGDHGDFPITSKMGGIVAETVVTTGISAVIDISDFTLGEQTEFLITFAEMMWQLKKKHRSPIHIFWEECHLFIPQERAPEPRAATLLNRVERLIRIGRSRGIGSSMISQFPQSIHKRCLNNAEVVFAFACSAKHERKAISEWFDSNTRGLEQFDVNAALPALETGTCIIASRRLLDVCEVVKILKKRTFDSSDTPEFGGKNRKRNYKLAPVDVEKLKGALDEALALAKANDPKLLREENERLKGELKQLQLNGKVERSVERMDKKDERIGFLNDKLEVFQERFDKLRALKVKELTRVAGDVSDDIDRLCVVGKEFSILRSSLDKTLASWQSATAAAFEQLNGSPVTFTDLAKKLTPSTTIADLVPSTNRIVGPVQVKMKVNGDASKPGRYKAQIVDVQPGDIKLVGKMQDMLDALSQGPLSRDDLITVVGMAPGGGSNNYVYALRNAGLIAAYSKGVFELTGEGRKLVRNTNYSRAVNDVVMRHSVVGGKMRDMVQVVRQSPAPKDQIILAVGMQPGGGSNNYVYALKNRGIFVQPSKGAPYSINPVLTS